MKQSQYRSPHRGLSIKDEKLKVCLSWLQVVWRFGANLGLRVLLGETQQANGLWRLRVGELVEVLGMLAGECVPSSDESEIG